MFAVLLMISGSQLGTSSALTQYAGVGGINSVPPAPTAKPQDRDVHLGLLRRAEGFTAGLNTCGFYNDDTPFMCQNSLASCVTSNGYFGCCTGFNCATSRNVYYTWCLDTTAPACIAQTQGPQTLCCMSIQWPFCVTALSTRLGSTVTGFVCGNNAVSGTQYLSPTPAYARVTPSSSTPSSSISSSTTTITPTPTPTPTQDPASTPIGAIVGGAIGGFAVLALGALGIFFILVRAKRKRDPETQQPGPDLPPQPSPVADYKAAPYPNPPQSPTSTLPEYAIRSSMIMPSPRSTQNPEQPFFPSPSPVGYQQYQQQPMAPAEGFAQPHHPSTQFSVHREGSEGGVPGSGSTSPVQWQQPFPDRMRGGGFVDAAAHTPVPEGCGGGYQAVQATELPVEPSDRELRELRG